MEEQSNLPPQPQESAAPATVPDGSPSGGTGCTGNCKNCHPLQQSYCAAQIGFNTMNAVADLQSRIANLQDAVTRLSRAVDALTEAAGEEPPAIIEAPTPAEPPKKTTKKPAKN